MKKLLIILLACTGFSVTEAQRKWVEDPNVTMRPLSGDFHEVHISSAFRLYLSQSDETALAVSAEDADAMNRIKTEVKNGILYIGIDGQQKWYGRSKKPTAYLSFRHLKKITGSGATQIICEGDIRAESLVIDLSGASDFSGSVQAGKLSIDLSGASDIKIRGRADSLFLHSSGASDLKAYELEAAFASVDVSGASDSQIFVSQELKARASGASSIKYKGGARISDIQNSGASSIKKRD